MFVENTQVSIGEHYSIRLSIEGNENRMCMKKMDDLSDNPATSKQSCKTGKIFHLPQDLFTWAGIDFPLHDDDKQKEGKEEKGRKKRRRKRR